MLLLFKVIQVNRQELMSIDLNFSSIKSLAYLTYTKSSGFILPGKDLFYGEPYKISVCIAETNPSKAQQDELYDMIKVALTEVGVHFATHGGDGFVHRYKQQTCLDNNEINITRGGPAFILLVVLKLLENTRGHELKVSIFADPNPTPNP